MARAAYERAWKAEHDDLPFHDGTFEVWAKAYSAETPYHRDDGLTIWVSDTDLTTKPRG